MMEKLKQRLLSEPQLIRDKKLLDFDTLRILNQNFNLLRSEEPIVKLDYINKQIHIPNIIDENTKKKLYLKIQREFQKQIESRILHINQRTIQKRITKIYLKNNTSTWGLCSSLGEITISINTLFTPNWVLDYIIVHELCHLIHPNHSKSFWNLVDRYYPKYREAKRFLKDKGFEFSL